MTAKIYHCTGPGRFSDLVEQPRKYVGEVEAADLDEAYYLSQNDRPSNGREGWSKFAPYSTTSTSWGDVIELDGEFYLVTLNSFQKVEKASWDFN